MPINLRTYKHEQWRGIRYMCNTVLTGGAQRAWLACIDCSGVVGWHAGKQARFILSRGMGRAPRMLIAKIIMHYAAKVIG